MICKNCKKKIKDECLFCPHCGLIPSIHSKSSNETITDEQKSLEKGRVTKTIYRILPILSVAVICLWFCKTITLNTSSVSGLYSLDFSLFYLLKGVALLSVVLAVVSLIVRILVLINKDKKTTILYFVSSLSDVVSLGCLIYKIINVKSIVLNGTYENLSSVGFNINTLGWVFIVVCILSIALHLILIFGREKTEGDN